VREQSTRFNPRASEAVRLGWLPDSFERSDDEFERLVEMLRGELMQGEMAGRGRDEERMGGARRRGSVSPSKTHDWTRRIESGSRSVESLEAIVAHLQDSLAQVTFLRILRF